MDYEKKYKEALEVAKRKLCFDKAGMVDSFTPNDIYEIFPELKENEDEKIRKELIGFLRNIPNSNYTCEEMALWLEKQGENHDDKYNITGIKSKHAEGKLGEMIKEIKSADKAEPKFKAGDWIVRELDNSVHQVKTVIENISNGKYGYDLTKGGYISSQDANFYHRWTIKDAKDGDVLVTGRGNIFIFKSISGYSVYDYCGLYYGEFMDCSACVNNPASEPIGYHPATKEEREQLEKAMADAGFTFDFDKKELKTIVTPRFEVGDVICDKSCTTLNKDAQPNMEIVDIKNGMYICDKGSFPVSQQDEYELVSKKIDSKLNDHSVSNELRAASVKHAEKELKNHTFPNNEEFELIYTFEEGAKWNAAQKHNWSDEDEEELKIALNTLEEAGQYSSAKWLKNVCLVPQTIQKPTEWSEEDEEIIRTIISDGIRGAEFDMLQIGWLKSLKERYTWKPSDEQMYNLSEAAHYDCAFFDMEILKGLYDDLKKLREE